MAYMGKNYRQEIEQIYGCERCMLNRSRNNVVVYRGSPRSDIMIVGEFPGAEEDKQAKAMTGPAGKYLVDLFGRNGLSLHDCYITYTVLCKPANNDTPSVDHMDACSRWLNWQIETVNPTWIIAVGKIAYSRLNPRYFRLNHDKIAMVEGKIAEPPHLEGRKVIAIQNPSVIVSAPTQASVYEKLIAEICAMIKKDRKK